MSDESIASSPPKKRFKQLKIMETMSKAAGKLCITSVCIFDLLILIICLSCLGSVKGNFSSVKISSDHVTLEIESEEDLIVSDSHQHIVAVKQVKQTTVEEQCISSSLEEVFSVNLHLSWKGKSISALQHLTRTNCADLLNIIPGRNHVVLFHASYYKSTFIIVWAFF